jgi:hypothetical protein
MVNHEVKEIVTLSPKEQKEKPPINLKQISNRQLSEIGLLVRPKVKSDADQPCTGYELLHGRVTNI